MASWDGVEISVGAPTCGAGFLLDVPTKTSARYDLPQGSAVLQSGATVVVVTPSDLELRGDELLRVGFDTANEALDVHWAMARGAHSLRSAHRNGLLWWSHKGGVTARIRTSVEHQMNSDVSFVVRREGVVIQDSADEPPPAPSPELAYLRRAQIADDAYDAYRNLWLALEAALQRVEPKAGEEWEWLTGALARVDDLYPGGFGKVWPAFIDRHYAAYRCALFHAARDDRRTPGVHADLLEVTAALEEAAQLVPQLVQRVLGWNSGRGIITESGWAHSVDAVADGLTLGVSEDGTPASPDMTEPCGPGHAVDEMPTAFVTQRSRPFERIFQGRFRTESMNCRAVRSTFQQWVDDEKTILMTRGDEPELQLSGLSHVEAHMAWHATHHALARVSFSR